MSSLLNLFVNLLNSAEKLENLENKVTSYRVSHTYLTKVILLKMTLKCIVHMKARHFYNHKDPPFDMNYHLMSADQRPVVDFDLK